MPGVATLDAAPGQSSLSLFGRNWVHRPALTLAREQEALVALLGDLIALPAVPADAFRAEVGQEAARLPGDVGSHVPGIDARHQARVHDLGDMGAPRVLRLRDRLDRCKLGSSHVGDAFGDPLDVLLDRHPRVRQHRGALRAGIAELDVRLKVEALGAVLEVTQDLVLLRVALGPVPLLQQVLVERVTVNVAVGVAARSGIAIPVPGAADAIAGLEHGDVQVELVAQRMQHVHTGEAGADDDCIEVGFHASPSRLALHIRHDTPPVDSILLASLSCRYGLPPVSLREWQTGRYLPATSQSTRSRRRPLRFESREAPSRKKVPPLGGIYAAARASPVA